ncbi:MAG: glycosyltransferase [Clostridia bacterium]|nr:glycosyltransferase [Clostridia bacterium]
MKVLVMSNTAGQGHNATGKAICNMLVSMGATAEMIDSYEYINTALGEAVNLIYLMSTGLTPHFYGSAYRMAELQEKQPDFSPTYIVNKILSVRIYDFLEDYDPDVIVCTHVFSAIIANLLKKEGKTKATIISIITDFTIHPFWQEVDCGDWFVTPSFLIDYAARVRGMDAAKFMHTGIPIHPKFSKKTDKKEARRILGMDENKNTVLLMSGSMGYGNIGKHLKKIDQLDIDLQIIVVCGSNKRSYRKIKRMQLNKDVYLHGYADNVEVMMDAADCIITKPGGLTSSEAMAKELPMIIVNPIPGQEDRNTEFFLNNGLALKVSDTFGIDEALFYIFETPNRIERMRENIRLMGKPNATYDLCKFIMDLEEPKTEAKTETEDTSAENTDE